MLRHVGVADLRFGCGEVGDLRLRQADGVTQLIFTTSDGLPTNKFSPNAAWTSPTGEFFFGTLNGVVSFFPSRIISNKYIPPVVLTSFKIFNKEIALNYESSYMTEIEIPYKQNVLSFETAALNYIDPQRNQYAYKLEGFNNEWSYIKSAREIPYTNLDPGSYILRIKASNNDGIWNETGLSIKLIILPPWYRTLWAYVIYLQITISIYFGIRKYELNKVKTKNELKLKRIESELRIAADKVKSDFFSNVSNELRTPLMLINEQIVVLKEKLTSSDSRKPIEFIEQSSQDLLKQINQFIDYSELEAGNMKLQVS